MKKASLLWNLMLAGFAAGTPVAMAADFMNEATLVYPSGVYGTMAPMSVSVTWNNQEISLIDPETDDYGDEFVTTYVVLGEEEELPVKAYILSSLGDPTDPDDLDIWNLELALYELDELFDFTGNSLTVKLPEGIVENTESELNPEQEFLFEILPAFTDYTVDPASGETLEADNLKVTISFGGNDIDYLQAEVRAMVYEPEFKDISLAFGEEVSIEGGNSLVLDLSSLESGYYELIIPEGYVTVDADGQVCLSPDIWLEFDVVNDVDSGVAMIRDLKATSAVYDLNGNRILNDFNQSSINDLPKGIYIIGGKKVVAGK